MILKKLKVLDIERLGDADEGVEAGISNDSLPFMFEILSTQFYSNSIGSTIREIVSNCFDSHQEAGVDDPVIVRKGYDSEEGYYIEFQDFGVGLSIDRMYKVYMNYFSSTKRATNDLIGGFGLGSKTPLSYADLFYITTFYDGLKYEYIYHKGESKPTLESLNGYDEVEEEYYVNSFIDEAGQEIELEEPLLKTRIRKTPTGIPTEERNGTIIKVIIANGDSYTFEKEIKQQLTYFDNIYFEGWSGVSNNYEIYEGKNFIFRSDINQVNTEIHICIGKVRYAIDFNTVKIDRDHRYIPIGIKFEIGELQITPNRESIRYNDESIKLIKERLELAVNELTDLYNKQNPEMETLAAYVYALKSEAKIVLNKEKGHVINLWKYSNLSKSFKFKPLSELGLKKHPAELFFGWEIAGEFYGEELKPRFYNNSVNNAIILEREPKYVIIDKDTKVSKYTNLFIQELLVGGVIALKKRKIDFERIDRFLGLSNTKKESNKARTIYGYNKVIEKLVEESSSGHYKDLKPTEEWIADYKKRVREQSLAFQRRKNKTVFVRQAPSFNGVTVSEYELNTRTGILVYGFREDKEKLSHIYDLVADNVNSIYSLSCYRREKSFMVIQIAKNIENSVIGAKKTIYWEDFIKTKFFANIYSAKWLIDKIASSGIRSDQRLKAELIPHYIEDIKALDDLVGRYIQKADHVYFKGCLNIEESKIRLNPEMVKMYEYLSKKYFNIRIPFQNTLANIPYDKQDRKDYIDYLKYRKIRLRNTFYLKDDRQLKYEKNLRIILRQMKGEIKTPLLLTLNQNNQNGNENSDSNQETEQDRD